MEKEGLEKVVLSYGSKKQKLILCEVSNEYTHDGPSYLEEALKGTSRKKGKVLFDRDGDGEIYFAINKQNKKDLSTPPKISNNPAYRRRV